MPTARRRRRPWRFASLVCDSVDVGDIVAVALSSSEARARDVGMELVAKWLGPTERNEDQRRVNAVKLAQQTTLAPEPRDWPLRLWLLLDAADAAERHKAQATFARVLLAISIAVGPEKKLAWNAEEARLDECAPSDLADFFVRAEARGGIARAATPREDRLVRFGVPARGVGFLRQGARARPRRLAGGRHAAAHPFRRRLSAPRSVPRRCRPQHPPKTADACCSRSSRPEPSRRSWTAQTSQRSSGRRRRRPSRSWASRLRPSRPEPPKPARLLDASVSLLREGDCSERAVEVLAAMCGNSQVKEEIVHGSGRVAGAAIDLVCHLPDMRGDNPVAYGVATLLAAVTVTNNELRQRHFREKEMDITPEQYDEFQRLTKQKAQDDADLDTEELCRKRCRKLVLCDGVALVATMASTSPSASTAERLAEVLVNLAKDTDLRGTLVQQGGFKAAVALAADDAQSATCRLNAAHAAAKILVTTNPNALTDAQRLAPIRPLLWLCRQYKAFDLMHFEACLALTNLTSLGDTAKARVASEKGIHALEYLQFSENDDIQRAATEALCNMVPNPDFIEHLKKPDKIRLWLALSLEYEKDDRLASAAIGCLAMASSHLADEIAAAPKCFDTLAELVQLHDRPPLVHRAAFCVANLARHTHVRAKLIKTDLPNQIRTAAAALANVDNYALLGFPHRRHRRAQAHAPRRRSSR